MEYDKGVCPVVNIDGILATGKQFDLDITLPCDDRSVIYGIVKDCYGDPVCNAVVKLVEVVCDCGKEERRPVSHTFTDKEGEFVFGPLCSNRFYEISIWVDEVKHCKIFAESKHEGKCLKGIKLDCPPCKSEKPCKEDKPCKEERPCKEEKPCRECHEEKPERHC